MQASAPGKVILCGEHAVVYGQPAIALPLPDLRARATITNSTNGFAIDLPDLGERLSARATPRHPLVLLARSTLDQIGVHVLPDITITLRSAIPIASGMGSGAALGAALVRAIAMYAGATLTPQDVARLVYESERFYHGTPSGIDNTVVSYEQAIWFVRTTDDGRRTTTTPTANPQPPTANPQPPAPIIESIAIGRPFHLVIGDTGVRAPTRLTVGGVRERWLADRERYDALFAAIGSCVQAARSALASGDLESLGALLDQNQALLDQIGVSSPELDRLILAARDAGALGTKLSGGGGGGIMLALATEEQCDQIAARLRTAGAVRVVQTRVGSEADVVPA